MPRLWLTLAFGLLLALVAPAPLRAQVSLETSLDQEQFLPAEKILVKVRIHNQAGRTIKFATQPGWLTFGVETLDGFVVPKLSEVPVDGEFELESASRGTFRVNLTPHFEITQPARYRVRAQLAIPELNQIINAAPIHFEINPGSKLWSTIVGLPPLPSDPPNSPSEERAYLLQQVNYLKNLRLYVRITDPTEEFTHSIQSLGAMVSFTKPTTLVDSRSRLHVLHQFSGSSYSYHLITPHGDLLERRVYDIGEVRPKLRVNETGEVLVIGGVRRFTPSDIPALPPANATSAADANSATNSSKTGPALSTTNAPPAAVSPQSPDATTDTPKSDPPKSAQPNDASEKKPRTRKPTFNPKPR